MGRLGVIAVAAALSIAAVDAKAAQLFPPYGPTYTDAVNYVVPFSFAAYGYSTSPWTFSVPSYDVTLGEFVAYSIELNGVATSIVHYSPADTTLDGTTYGSNDVGLRGPAAGVGGGVSGMGYATRIDANTYQIKDPNAGVGSTVFGSWALPDLTAIPYLTYEVTLNQTVSLCCQSYNDDSKTYVGTASATYYYNAITTVPEPASLILLSGGLAAAAWVRRRA